MDELGNIETLDSGHDLKGFDCGEVALNTWLTRHALKNQASNNSRTFVLPTIPSCGNKVVGFYALVIASLTHEDAIASLLSGTPRNQTISAILLARLGVSKEYQGKGLGAALLKDALKQCLIVSQHVGVRAVLVHAKPGADAFYIAKAGFERSPTDPLHLMLPIQDIADAFK
jgi:GNAT superfamily N-acetyltransferase